MLRAFLDAWRKDRWVRPFLSRYRGILCAAILLSVVAYACAGALMFTSGYMISLAATIPLTVLALHVPSIFVRIFGIGKPIVQYVERLASHDWVLRMTSSLRRRLYDAVERTGGVDAARRGRFAGRADAGEQGAEASGVGSAAGMSSLGRMLSLFASDIEHVQDLFLRTVLPLVVMLLVYLLVVVALGAFSLLMGLLVLVVMGVVAIVMPLWSVAVNGARVMRLQAVVSDLYDATLADVMGIADWRLSGRRDDLLARVQGGYERRHELAASVRRFERLIAVTRQCLFALVASALFLWAAWAFGSSDAVATGSVLLATGFVDELGGVTMHDSAPHAANWIAAFVLCAFPLLEAFAPATDAVLGFVRHASAIQDLNQLDPAEGREGEAAEDGARSQGIGLSGLGVVEAPFRQEAATQGNAIELEGVAFAHGGHAPLLYDGLSLRIPKGQCVAVIGRSGAGKSTLLDLIRGLKAPLAGSVRVSGRIGVIEQAPYVFRKSLRENLLLADPSASDAAILHALEAVGLGELAERLPEGLSAEMAEGGITLSGGERHRLALARILLAKSDIVLLDEPYLGLDAATEREVSQTMLEALAGKTLVVVTHGLQGIDAYDRVIMIGRGHIEADGSPGELARTDERFQRLLAFEHGEGRGHA